jgi:hypothetical protein
MMLSRRVKEEYGRSIEQGDGGWQVCYGRRLTIARKILAIAQRVLAKRLANQ